MVVRSGRFHRQVPAGICLLLPSIDRLVLVDLRERPHVVGPQQVVTRDNQPVTASATVYIQVVDARAAIFNVSSYSIAVDQAARLALRDVFANLSLADALADRRPISAAMQEKMRQVTGNWGVRINLVEIVDVSPPAGVLPAIAGPGPAAQENAAWTQVVAAVRSGGRITLTEHGEPVADIVPRSPRQRSTSGAEMRHQLELRAADAALQVELDALAGQTLDEL